MLVNNFFILIVYIYKLFLSPILPSVCRHSPTCSSYAILVLKKYFLLKSIFLICIRIMKCNQFFDPECDDV